MYRVLFFITLAILVNSKSVSAVDMELIRLDGKSVKLSDYRGKWVIVNYWATWCPPCKEELPELQAYHDDHYDSDGVVLGVNTEVMKKEDVLEFLDDYFVTYPNFISGPVSKTALGTVPGLPTTFVVSPDGNVEARQVGGVTRKMIESFIEKWGKSNIN